MADTAQIQQFLETVPASSRSIFQALRATIAEAVPALAEEIKWNAPSFRLNDEHIITTGLQRDGSVRLVLHRGAKPKPLDGFQFQDPTRLANWAAADRGVMVFRSPEEVVTQSEAIQELLRRWVQTLQSGTEPY